MAKEKRVPGEPKKRLYVYLTKDTVDRIAVLSVKLGKTQSGVASLAVATGIEALEMALNPNLEGYWKMIEEKMKSGTNIDS